MAKQRIELWGGWSLALPSSCNTARNPDGSWSAWDESHVVDISIVEVGGRVDGTPIPPDEMLTGTETWTHRPISGAIARVSSDVEVVDAGGQPQQVEWTRVQAAAQNTVLIMSVGNPGQRDLHWHEAVWQSLAHSDQT